MNKLIAAIEALPSGHIKYIEYDEFGVWAGFHTVGVEGGLKTDDLKALVAQLKWIPVSDPPKKDGEYLTRYGSAVEILDYIGGIWYDGNGNEVVFGSPELWMPIPPYTAERGEDGE